jgi:hypothetical protein
MQPSPPSVPLPCPPRSCLALPCLLALVRSCRHCLGPTTLHPEKLIHKSPGRICPNLPPQPFLFTALRGFSVPSRSRLMPFPANEPSPPQPSRRRPRLMAAILIVHLVPSAAHGTALVSAVGPRALLYPTRGSLLSSSLVPVTSWSACLPNRRSVESPSLPFRSVESIQRSRSSTCRPRPSHRDTHARRRRRAIFQNIRPQGVAPVLSSEKLLLRLPCPCLLRDPRAPPPSSPVAPRLPALPLRSAVRHGSLPRNSRSGSTPAVIPSPPIKRLDCPGQPRPTTVLLLARAGTRLFLLGPAPFSLPVLARLRLPGACVPEYGTGGTASPSGAEPVIHRHSASLVYVMQSCTNTSLPSEAAKLEA